MIGDRMAIWTQCEHPPASALKQIPAGRLKGKTDINPQWRYRMMTEMFGPVGKGWWYTIRERWTETVGKEVMCFVTVELSVAGHEHPIVGVGGNKLAVMEHSDVYANDEGWKMALTDALSVAMKALGVGAAVYEGRWDGSKYSDAGAVEYTAQTRNDSALDSFEIFVRTVETAKSGVGKSTGKPWTLTRITGDADGKDVTVKTFADCSGVAAGVVVKCMGLTWDERDGVYFAKTIDVIEDNTDKEPNQ